MTLAHLADFAIETRRAEHALLEMRQRNELILGAAADGIVGVDAEGLVTFANPAASRLLGRRLEEMIGPSVENFMRLPRVGSSTDVPSAPTPPAGPPGQG